MDPIDELLSRAEGAAADPPGDLPAQPRMEVAVVTCMDARIDVFRLLGLGFGDAHVIRNAGGVVTDDTVRSLAISQHMLGTRAIILIRHTGCGMIGLDDQEFADRLAAHAGVRPDWRAHGFDELRDGVREQVQELRRNPFLLHTDAIRGFVLETATAALTEVAR